MIFPEGYVPFKYVFKNVHSFIDWRVRKEMSERDLLSSNSEEARALRMRVSANSREASLQFVRRLEFRAGERPALYTFVPNGQVFRLERDILSGPPNYYTGHPSYWVEVLEARDLESRKPGKIRRHTTAAAFKEDFWLEKIFDSEIETKRKSPSLSFSDLDIVDDVEWCIGLDMLEDYLEAAMLAKKFTDFTAGLGIETRSFSRFVSQSDAARKKFRRWKEFDGCPVLVKKSDFEKFLDQIEPVATDTLDELSVVEKILKIKAELPHLKKTDVFFEINDPISRRQFDLDWKVASEVNPEIAKSGRKKLKS